MPFMLPFNIIGDIANPVSQTLRHFANILAGSVIGGLIYFALGQDVYKRQGLFLRLLWSA